MPPRPICRTLFLKKQGTKKSIVWLEVLQGLVLFGNSHFDGLFPFNNLALATVIGDV